MSGKYIVLTTDFKTTKLLSPYILSSVIVPEDMVVYGDRIFYNIILPNTSKVINCLKLIKETYNDLGDLYTLADTLADHYISIDDDNFRELLYGLPLPIPVKAKNAIRKEISRLQIRDKKLEDMLDFEFNTIFD